MSDRLVRRCARTHERYAEATEEGGGAAFAHEYDARSTDPPQRGVHRQPQPQRIQWICQLRVGQCKSD